MRLGTLLTDAGPRAVALRGGELVELPGTVRGLLAAGPEATRRAVEEATAAHPCEPARLGPAVPDPGKVLCIGRNYVEHVEELGGERPPERPEVFMRARTSLAGPYQPVRRPWVSQQMDWERGLRLGALRGQRLPQNAQIQSRGLPGQAARTDPGKQPGEQAEVAHRLDQLAVHLARRPRLGQRPELSGGEVPDPFGLELSTTVVDADGGERVMQRSNTSLMVHRIPDLIAFLSLFTTLEPGDVIATGTPGGVGLGRTPPVWLEPGQTVVCRVESLGDLKNQVVEEAGPST